MDFEIISKKISFLKQTENEEIEKYRNKTYGFFDFHKSLILPNLLNHNLYKSNFFRNTRHFFISNEKLNFNEDIFNLAFGILYYDGFLFDNSLKNYQIFKGFLNKAFIANTTFENCSFSHCIFFKNEFHGCKFENCSFAFAVFKSNVFFNCIFNKCDFEKNEWGCDFEIINEKLCVKNNIAFKNNVKNSFAYDSGFASANGIGQAVFFDASLNYTLDQSNLAWNANDLIIKNKTIETKNEINK